MIPIDKQRVQEVYQQKKKETEIHALKKIIEEKDKRIIELEMEIRVLMKMVKNKI